MSEKKFFGPKREKIEEIMKTNSSLEQELKKIEDENKKLRARNLKSKTPTNNNIIGVVPAFAGFPADFLAHFYQAI